MAAWLLFFLIGLIQFMIHVWLRRQKPKIRHLFLIIGGLLAGGAIALLPVRIPTPEFRLPPLAIPLIGALSGILIGMADKFGLFNRQLFQFFMTPGLSLILAVLSTFFMIFYLAASGQENVIHPHLFPIALTFLLIAFMTIFGYTFPRRWFKQYFE